MINNSVLQRTNYRYIVTQGFSLTTSQLLNESKPSDKDLRLHGTMAIFDLSNKIHNKRVLGKVKHMKIIV